MVTIFGNAMCALQGTSVNKAINKKPTDYWSDRHRSMGASRDTMRVDKRTEYYSGFIEGFATGGMFFPVLALYSMQNSHSRTRQVLVIPKGRDFTLSNYGMKFMLHTIHFTQCGRLGNGGIPMSHLPHPSKPGMPPWPAKSTIPGEIICNAIFIPTNIIQAFRNQAGEPLGNEPFTQLGNGPSGIRSRLVEIDNRSIAAISIKLKGLEASGAPFNVLTSQLEPNYFGIKNDNERQLGQFELLLDLHNNKALRAYEKQLEDLRQDLTLWVHYLDYKYSSR